MIYGPGGYKVSFHPPLSLTSHLQSSQYCIGLLLIAVKRFPVDWYASADCSLDFHHAHVGNTCDLVAELGDYVWRLLLGLCHQGTKLKDR